MRRCRLFGASKSARSGAANPSVRPIARSPCSVETYNGDPMRAVTAREANQSFSRILKAAESGESVVITRRGEPVAIIAPYRRSAIANTPLSMSWR